MVRHNANILFTDGRITGIQSFANGRSYNEARAWMQARMIEIKALGYTVKAFNITSLRVAF